MITIFMDNPYFKSLANHLQGFTYTKVVSNLYRIQCLGNKFCHVLCIWSLVYLVHVVVHVLLAACHKDMAVALSFVHLICHRGLYVSSHELSLQSQWEYNCNIMHFFSL
jgi:hypothetical protein